MYNQQSKKHDRFKKEVASVMNKTIVMDGATRMNYSRCVHILMWMIVNIFDGLSSFPSASFLLWMLAFALGLLDLMCLTKNMNNVCIVCFRQVVYALDYFVEKIKLYDCSQWCRWNVSLSCRCVWNTCSVRCNNLRDSCRTNVAAMDVSGLDQEIEVGSIAAWKNLQKRRARHRFGYGVLFIGWFKFMAVVCFAMQVVVVNGYEKMPDGCKGNKVYNDRDCDLRKAIDELNADGSGTHSTYGPVADWDMSLVTDLSNAFRSKGSFNGDISKWQTQKVTTLYGSK